MDKLMSSAIAVAVIFGVALAIGYVAHPFLGVLYCFIVLLVTIWLNNKD